MILSLLTLASTAAAQSAWTVGQTVQTTSGQVKGHVSAWKPAVSEYLGVPYAQPPLGALRFAAPQPFRGTREIDAREFGASCPANIEQRAGSVDYSSFAKTLLGILGQVGDRFDEDCLTLNVWAKPDGKKKAVLVWIYGGGFGSGNSRSPSYNGARLADENDVVVVSINYRVNVFGFPRADFLPAQNVGLLDQRLGVEWVRDNVARFGGDPEKITLFGQSAGGASVDYYAYAWTKDPIVNGIIAESGTAANLGGPARNVSASWYMLSQKLGCGGAEAGARTLACVQGKPWQDVLGAMEKRGVTPNLGVGGFGPTADGKVVFGDYAKRRAEGNFIKVPLIVGNTNNEGGFYKLLDASHSGAPLPTRGPATGADPSSGSGCGAHAAAAARVAARVPAWRYVYSGEFPNQDIGVRGAWHGSEIGLVFGTSELLSHRPDTEEERKLSARLRAVWAGFARNPRTAPAEIGGWPFYDAKKETVVRIGGENSSAIAYVARAKYDAACP